MPIARGGAFKTGGLAAFKFRPGRGFEGPRRLLFCGFGKNIRIVDGVF
jgi:hypothetical protein